MKSTPIRTITARVTAFLRAAVAATLFCTLVFAGVQLDGNYKLIEGDVSTGEASTSGNGYFLDIDWEGSTPSFGGAYDSGDARYEDDHDNWIEFTPSAEDPNSGTFESNIEGHESGAYLLTS